MIMDVPAANVYSQTYSKDGVWLDHWAPGPDGLQGTADDLGTFKASGWDAGEGGTNVVTAVSDTSTFTFTFTLGSGASWDGSWQFLVDGSKYGQGTANAPGDWVQDFFGDYGTGGGLSGNMGSGYPIPEPVTMAGLALGIGCLARYVRKRR
jgi:hypothetical protein